jgi:membrane protein involved in D-alanine export
MIPYADFLYFGVALYVILPTLVVRLTLGFSQIWILIATLGMLAVQYGGTLNITPKTGLPELGVVGGYAFFQWIVAAGFLWARPRTVWRWPYYLALLLALLPLLAAKFLPLLAPGTLLGFVGISYVTFRSLDVIFGIQDRLIPALPPGQFLAYLLFFPTISSGPIDRWRRFADDWKRPRTRAEFLPDLDQAVHRIFTGFFYKFILAALIKQYWMDAAAEATGFLAILSYMYAYTFYLFFDFAGYSAFAIGFSYLFGIHTPENFNKPFLASNIRDFWNRWHITLSWWLRDHIYMRFVLAATKGKWFRDKHVASYLGLFLSFGLMGLWHGTELHYLVYGLYHGSLLVGYELFIRWNKQRKWWGEGLPWRIAGALVTLHAVAFSFLVFSGRLF